MYLLNVSLICLYGPVAMGSKFIQCIPIFKQTNRAQCECVCVGGVLERFLLETS